MSSDRTEQALEIASRAVACALRVGASCAEASLAIADRFSVEARAATLTQLERSTGTSLWARVFVDGRKAALRTSDTSASALEELIAHTVAQAAAVERDPYAGLPDAASVQLLVREDLDLYSGEVAARSDEAKVNEALELERLVRAADAGIDNSNGSHAADAVVVQALCNSNGFAGSYRATRASRSSSAVATDGANKRTGAYGTAARHLSELESVGEVARATARRTVELFGARKPLTMRGPVIFERDVAAAVLGDIFSAVSAANVDVANSWLAGCVGARIGSELVTVVDDGRLPRRLGSAPFDAEGVPTQRTVVFDRGMLRTFLFDTYYARKLGARSTGNAGTHGVEPNSFYLVPGSQTLEDVIASTKRGVLVVDTIGFATEHASGIYSRGARGFMIENGERAYPIDEFTVAGTFGDMLAGVDAVANDLRFDSNVVSPSFRVAEMTISGT